MPDGKRDGLGVSMGTKSQTTKLGAKRSAQQREETKADESVDSSSSEDNEVAEQRFVQPLSTDPLKQDHIDAVGGPGQLLCFLQVYDMKPGEELRVLRPTLHLPRNCRARAVVALLISSTTHSYLALDQSSGVEPSDAVVQT